MSLYVACKEVPIALAADQSVLMYRLFYGRHKTKEHEIYVKTGMTIKNVLYTVTNLRFFYIQQATLDKLNFLEGIFTRVQCFTSLRVR